MSGLLNHVVENEIFSEAALLVLAQRKFQKRRS